MDHLQEFKHGYTYFIWENTIELCKLTKSSLTKSNSNLKTHSYCSSENKCKTVIYVLCQSAVYPGSVCDCACSNLLCSEAALPYLVSGFTCK